MGDRFEEVLPPPSYDTGMMLGSLPPPPTGNMAAMNPTSGGLDDMFDSHLTTLNSAAPLTFSYNQSNSSSSSMPLFPPFNGNASYTGTENQLNDIHQDKHTVYGHPLFPLLALIFEKCELATCTRRITGDPICSSESFNEDLLAFSKQFAERNEGSIFTNNQEADNLMIQGIQNFRFHLLELEKVHELCDNFCERYITCLKGKMPNDLNVEVQGDDDDTASKLSNSNFDPTDDTDSGSDHRPSSNSSLPYTDLDDYHVPTNNVPVMSPTEKPAVQPPQKEAKPQKRGIKREREDPDDSKGSDESNQGQGEVTTTKGAKRSKKRGIFSKAATNILRAWLFQHLNHPYPSEEQKKQLGGETGLTILQVNNWFINARRRIVQPMIDQTNRSAPGSHSGYPGYYPETGQQIENHTVAPSVGGHRLPGSLPGSIPGSIPSSINGGYGGLHNNMSHASYQPSLASSDTYDPLKPAYPTPTYIDSSVTRYNMMSSMGLPTYSGGEMYAPPNMATSYYNIPSNEL